VRGVASTGDVQGFSQRSAAWCPVATLPRVGLKLNRLRGHVDVQIDPCSSAPLRLVRRPARRPCSRRFWLRFPHVASVLAKNY
jgi:hypothetical protein